MLTIHLVTCVQNNILPWFVREWTLCQVILIKFVKKDEQRTLDYTEEEGKGAVS